MYSHYYLGVSMNCCTVKYSVYLLFWQAASVFLRSISKRNEFVLKQLISQQYLNTILWDKERNCSALRVIPLLVCQSPASNNERMEAYQIRLQEVFTDC